MSQTTVVPRLPTELVAHILRYQVVFNFPIGYKRHQILFIMRILPLIRGHNHDFAEHVLETYYKSNVFQIVIPGHGLRATFLHPAFAHRIQHLRLVVLLDSNLSRQEIHPLDYVIHFNKPRIKRIYGRLESGGPQPNTNWQLNLTDLKTMTIVLDFGKWRTCLAESVQDLRQAQDDFFIPLTLDKVEVIASGAKLCECGCIDNMMKIIHSGVVSRPTPT